MRIFLSSTFKDLQEERATVTEVLRQMDLHYEAMEEFPAGVDPEDHCRRMVERCDVLILLLGHRYGSCPQRDGRSYTEIEYDVAWQLKRLILPYAPSPEVRFRVDQISVDEEDLKKREAFKRKVSCRHNVVQYLNPDHLSSRISAHLHWHWKREKENVRTKHMIKAKNVPFYIVLRAQRALRDCIDICETASEETDDILKAQHQARSQFGRLRLRFDGQITSLNEQLICVAHEDSGLVGESFAAFPDAEGHRVWDQLRQVSIGNLVWIDRFSRHEFSENELSSLYDNGIPRGIRLNVQRINFACYSYFMSWSWFIIVEGHHEVLQGIS